MSASSTNFNKAIPHAAFTSLGHEKCNFLKINFKIGTKLVLNIQFPSDHADCLYFKNKKNMLVCLPIQLFLQTCKWTVLI